MNTAVMQDALMQAPSRLYWVILVIMVISMHALLIILVIDTVSYHKEQGVGLAISQ